MGGPRDNHFPSNVVCVLVPELSATTYYFRNQLIAENSNVGLNSIVYIPVVLRENVISSWLNQVLKSIRFSPSTMMKLIIISLFCLVALCKAFSMFGMIAEAEWSAFKARYNKQYTTIEEEFRKKVFVENKLRIINHNQQFMAGEITYALKINEFADLLPHEFSSYMLGLSKSFKIKNNKINGSTYLTPAHVFLPKAVDWRRRGYVTPVKNQGQCGSCWAFSTTGSLEGQHYRKTGKLVSLSEQNLVDCAGSFDTHGCNGGLMDNAFEYIKENGGIDTESSYNYEAQDGTCRFNKANIGATVSGFVDVKSGDEDALLEAVATVGPVSVAIDASHESFQFYSHGVYSEPSCSKYELDHGVLVVGYGTDNKDNDYWIVKNSWGDSWGLRGYIKMARNLDNNCGIATVPSYPLV